MGTEFYEERTNILMLIDQVQDCNRETDPDGNKKAMMALGESLTVCGDDLPGICSNIVRVTLELRKIRMGGRDAPERAVTLRDTAILRAAIRHELEPFDRARKSAKARGGAPPAESAEIVILRKALARFNAVQLFYNAVHGGTYRYNEYPEEGGDPVQMQRTFGGIPENKWPKTLQEIRKGNVIEKVRRIDLRTTPENAVIIREILRELEETQPTVELPVRYGKGNVESRVVIREGEADFFWNHLPRGLREPRKKEAT